MYQAINLTSFRGFEPMISSSQCEGANYISLMYVGTLKRSCLDTLLAHLRSVFLSEAGFFYLRPVFLSRSEGRTLTPGVKLAPSGEVRP
jgi:hypothetical protein